MGINQAAVQSLLRIAAEGGVINLTGMTREQCIRAIRGQLTPEELAEFSFERDPDEVAEAQAQLQAHMDEHGDLSGEEDQP